MDGKVMVSSTNHPIALPFQLLKKKKIKTIEAVGLPCSSNGKEICLQYRRLRFDPWVGKILWRREWQSTPVLLPEEFHGQRRLAGCSPWGCKTSDTTETNIHTQG